MIELEQRLNNEKSRQLVALREKLSTRKDRKLKEKRQQQELKLQKEMLQQIKELDRCRTKRVCYH